MDCEQSLAQETCTYFKNAFQEITIKRELKATTDILKMG